ncbi:Outer membrane protein assembly factor BamC [wastewater metagenome]|uniref:Outer membrane protein assembly factor BamC n=2 Tax=unclassified sequences TaxID=12908 RepID=A0A5B8RHC5_9ZZZZ|nr:outer membrane protein assembly factor BamC [Arhodomonas sp. KWT]QEA07383.1 outer membrane protein assembly factor BamC [uncultured organism]
MNRSLALTAAVALTVTLSGCSWFGWGDDAPSSQSRIEQLQLPPDLTRDQASGSMLIPEDGVATARGGNNAVLPQPDSVTVQRAGDDRWLNVSAPPKKVWQWVSDFLDHQGVKKARSQPAVGIAETEWLFTNKPVTGGVFAPTLPGPEDATVADRYLIRVEPGREADSAEVFVAHRRVRREGDGWTLAGNDPFLEAEFLRSMLVYFGYAQERSHEAVAAASATQPQANVTRVDGEPRLVLGNDFFNAWRRVGLALDRAGFTVSDRNRSDGIYYVRYDTKAETGAEPPEEGFLESFAFWRDEPVPDTVRTYRVVLDSADGETRVRVEADKADTTADPEIVERMLSLIAEQLR